MGWVATPSGNLRFAVRGEGPPLLLLHGLGDSLAGWAQVVPRLARSHEVHLLDLPGHGLSGAPPDFRLRTLTAAVAHYAGTAFAGRAPVLAGHSLGAWIALRLVLSSAVAPARLVLINPGGALLAREEWAPFRALVSATDRAGVLRYLEAAFHRPPLALRLFPGEVVRAMGAPASRGILDALVEEDFLAEAELLALRLPVRLVWGERDRLLPPGTLEFFRRAIPHVEVRLLRDAGHLPHLEAPRELARAIV